MKYIYFLIDQDTGFMELYSSKAKALKDQKRYGGVVVRHTLGGTNVKDKVQNLHRCRRKSS